MQCTERGIALFSPDAIRGQSGRSIVTVLCGQLLTEVLCRERDGAGQGAGGQVSIFSSLLLLLGYLPMYKSTSEWQLYL